MAEIHAFRATDGRAAQSPPPIPTSAVVATVLDSPELSALWDKELGAMRERIRANRQALVERLTVHAPRANFHFVLEQRGMFSYSGLTKEQVGRLRLRSGFHIRRKSRRMGQPPSVH